MTKRAILTAFVLLLAVLMASPAQARRKKKKRKSRSKVVLVGCNDRAHKKVRSAVEKALKKKKFKVVKAKEDDSGHATKHKAVAVVLCSVEGRGKKWTVTIEVRNGATGSTLVTSTFEARKARKLGRAIKKTLWKEIKFAMGKASAPTGAEEVVVEADDDFPLEDMATDEEDPDLPDDEDPDLPNDEDPDFPDDEMGTEDFRSLDDDDPGDRRSPPPDASASASDAVFAAGAAAPLELHAGMRVFSRSLGYNTNTVPSYSLGTGTAIEAGVTWYPLAHLTNNTGILGRIGITAGMTAAFGLETGTDSGTDAFPTVSNWFFGGVRGYHPIGKHRVQLDLGYGGQSFIIKSTGSAMRPNFPNVKYRFGRVAASGLFAINDKLSASASIGYRLVLNSGQFESAAFFPKSSVAGIDFGASVSYTIMKNLQARAGFDFVRYGFSLNTTAGDPFIADSASDVYISGMVNAVYTFSD